MAENALASKQDKSKVIRNRNVGRRHCVDDTLEIPILSQAPAKEKLPAENAPPFPGPADAAQNAGTPANS